MLEIICTGYVISFTSLPLTLLPSLSLFRGSSHEALLKQEIDHLLYLGAIERVLDAFWGRGVYSKYFLIQKRTEGWRPILDLRKLNKFLRKQRFRMVTLASIIPELDEGDWFTALDLQDAYFHIPIHPSHRWYL